MADLVVTDAMLAQQHEELSNGIERLGRQLGRLYDKNERMRAELLAAAEQFARYADYHLAKQPPDREKAKTNVEWAARCREAVSAKIT